ncbi:MAG: hypothetical protein GY859_02745 [Desulfobacterales bacterium]|nr:hypothetical protein [Desulfobacterales bacterium]
MNCIDAMEGAGKHIISQFHHLYLEERLDDSEYIRNIKAVMEGIDAFIRENPEVTNNPLLLHEVLYNFSKDLWMGTLNENRSADPAPEDETDSTEREEYDNYYFDYIYQYGSYPL